MPSPDNMAVINEVYQFWFGSMQPTLPDRDRKQVWFGGSSKVDAQVKSLFGEAVELALQGKLTSWAETAQGRLALILLLDQFPRNIYRGKAAAFAGDEASGALCREGLAVGHHELLNVVELTFFLLPLEHSEDLADQERCVHLFHRLLEQVDDDEHKDYVANALRYAEDHRDIIKQFGRFPHRNLALKRSDTPQEATYLASHGRRFGQ